MKNGIIFLVCMFCAVITLSAQQKFNVQNGTKTEFYNDLETAIQQAVSGDTIYLPGRVVQVQSDLTIDKKLAIIGAGWDVDSIGGLQTTEIKNGNNHIRIYFNEGSSGSLLMGCMIRDIYFMEQNVSNVTLWRNRITGNLILANNSSLNIKQIIVSENFINGTIHGNGGASECFVNNNCLSSGGIESLENSFINNNAMNSRVGYLTGCIVENNYIMGNMHDCQNSIFNNNAYPGTYSFPLGSNSGSNNLMNQLLDDTFTVNSFGLPKNLEIKGTSPCKNAGTDGTDIGIFGGPAPYKAGAVPFNPHITRSVISAQTDKDGKLKVDIEVSAQTR